MTMLIPWITFWIAVSIHPEIGAVITLLVIATIPFIMRKLQEEPSEEHLWDMILSYQNKTFKTYSGLSFTYEVRKGRNGEYTTELWIDRREKSKSLAWSSVRLAFHNIKQTGEMVERPKALGDIRGVTYIYGMFYRFGLIDVPDKVKEKMKEV